MARGRSSKRSRSSGSSSRSSRSATARDYPRTARLNELVREILADGLERVDDPRLELVTFTSVDVDADLLNAKVFYDCLDGEDGDATVLEALDDARIQLQRAIARQAHIKRVPHLSFAPDPAIRAGLRIEEILRDIPPAQHEHDLTAYEPAASERDAFEPDGADGPGGPRAADGADGDTTGADPGA